MFTETVRKIPPLPDMVSLIYESKTEMQNDRDVLRLALDGTPKCRATLKKVIQIFRSSSTQNKCIATAQMPRSGESLHRLFGFLKFRSRLISAAMPPEARSIEARDFDSIDGPEVLVCT
ncbi:hypothetical protein Q7P37_008692 [Cladosporium fusiforme]